MPKVDNSKRLAESKALVTGATSGLGFRISIALAQEGAEVIAIDKDDLLVDKIKDRVTHAVCLNVTDERSLRSVNISDVDVAIVGIGDNVEMSVMAVAQREKLLGEFEYPDGKIMMG